jgi:hypothetical protein
VGLVAAGGPLPLPLLTRRLGRRRGWLLLAQGW